MDEAIEGVDIDAIKEEDRVYELLIILIYIINYYYYFFL
jgi:hypothetical protein